MIEVFMTVPALALIPAILCFVAFWRTRLRVTLMTGLAWLAYAPYEYAMMRRWLCSGECNIRVDLLLIYPALLGLTVASIVVVARSKRMARR